MLFFMTILSKSNCYFCNKCLFKPMPKFTTVFLTTSKGTLIQNIFKLICIVVLLSTPCFSGCSQFYQILNVRFVLHLYQIIYHFQWPIVLFTMYFKALILIQVYQHLSAYTHAHTLKTKQ